MTQIQEHTFGRRKRNKRFPLLNLYAGPLADREENRSRIGDWRALLGVAGDSLLEGQWTG